MGEHRGIAGDLGGIDLVCMNGIIIPEAPAYCTICVLVRLSTTCSEWVSPTLSCFADNAMLALLTLLYGPFRTYADATRRDHQLAVLISVLGDGLP